MQHRKYKSFYLEDNVQEVQKEIQLSSLHCKMLHQNLML